MIQIKHRRTEAVLFESAAETLRKAVEEAVKQKANLGGANLGGANLGGANLGGANLGGANLGGANLGGANLGGAYLGDAYLGGANLGGAYLGDANLGGAYLGGAYLGGANLGDAYLGDANLGGAYLGDAYLGGANLGDAYLGGANLGGANLGGANLGGANLGGANLGGANLGGAYLGGANLGDAYLGDANLGGAYLGDANLGGAYLGGAYLGGAKGLPQTLPPDPATPYVRTVAKTDSERAERFRKHHPEVPVIADLDKRILAAIEAGGALDMSSWHSCATTHCRAGWAITLAGEKGAELEKKHGPQRAGMLIYGCSTGRVPHFFASNDVAMEDIRACAAKSAELASDTQGASEQ